MMLIIGMIVGFVMGTLVAVVVLLNWKSGCNDKRPSMYIAQKLSDGKMHDFIVHGNSMGEIIEKEYGPPTQEEE